MFLYDNMGNSYWKLLLMGKNVINAKKKTRIIAAALITTYSSSIWFYYISTSSFK